MIRPLIVACFCVSPAYAMATSWHCTGPLALLDGHIALPLQFELAFGDGEHFHAKGMQQSARASERFDWQGNWIKVEDQIAMIGPKVFNDTTSSNVELRARSLLLQDDVLLLRLIEATDYSETVRCLPEEKD